MLKIFDIGPFGVALINHTGCSLEICIVEIYSWVVSNSGEQCLSVLMNLRCSPRARWTARSRFGTSTTISLYSPARGTSGEKLVSKAVLKAIDSMTRFTRSYEHFIPENCLGNISQSGAGSFQVLANESAKRLVPPSPWFKEVCYV